MNIASSTEGISDADIEAKHLWMLSQELVKIRYHYCRTGQGAIELRDDLDLLAEMSSCPGVIRRARRLICEIDQQWPHMAVA